MFSLLLAFKRQKNSMLKKKKKSVSVKTSTEMKLHSQQTKPRVFNTHKSSPQSVAS